MAAGKNIRGMPLVPGGKIVEVAAQSTKKHPMTSMSLCSRSVLGLDAVR